MEVYIAVTIAAGVCIIPPLILEIILRCWRSWRVRPAQPTRFEWSVKYERGDHDKGGNS